MQVDLRALRHQVDEALTCCADPSTVQSAVDQSAPRICPAVDELYARLGCLEAATEAAAEASELIQDAQGAAEDAIFLH